MGLDNYPVPYPCLEMEKAGKLKVIRDEKGRIDCEKTNCPFKKLVVSRGIMFGTYCWIRGKIYNSIAMTANQTSLYEPNDRDKLLDLRDVLKAERERIIEERLNEIEFDYHNEGFTEMHWSFIDLTPTQFKKQLGSEKDFPEEYSKYLQKLKEKWSKLSYEQRKAYYRREIEEEIDELTEYLDILLSIKEWDGYLDAWW